MGAIGFRRGVLLREVNASGVVSLVGNLLPNWTGTPAVPTINVGVAGSYTLPVTGATTVTWKAPGSKPSWITFSGSLMSWSNAAVAGSLSGVVLTATNAGGSVDSNSFGITVISTIPAWTAVPSPVIIEGQSGSYTLPVSNATSVTWAGSVAQPAWLTLVAGSPPRLTWTAAPAAATIDPNCELIAVGPGGSVPSGKFGLVVGAATGFFAGWTTQQRAAAVSAGDSNNGWPYEGKHATFAVHPNGRSYFFGGDTPSSGDQRTWSVQPWQWASSPPTSAWRLEHPYWPLTGNYFPVHQDKNGVAWDSKRRVFWVMAGFNFVEFGTSAPEYGGPAGVIGFKQVVSKFDPAKAQGTQWTPTAVTMVEQGLGSIGGERAGPAVYDPVLDLVFHGNSKTYVGRVHAFDPAVPNYVFQATFTQAGLEIPSDGWYVHVIGIDHVNRYLWLLRGDYNSKTHNLYRVDLPSTRAGLPTNNSAVDWTSRATAIWSNPSSGGEDLLGATAFITREFQKLYFWRRGPISSMVTSSSQYFSAGYAGICGRPEIGTGSYGSANTGLLVDLHTGVTEYTQLPLGTYDDGIGWHIPSSVWFDPSGFVIYGAAANGVEGPSQRGSVVHYLARRRTQPSWAPGTLYQWKQVPNSNLETVSNATTGSADGKAVRAIWAGAEPTGRACRLEFGGNPYRFSRATLRQSGAYLLFHGGGGDDGEGNGVLSFQLMADSPTWGVLMPPTKRSWTADKTKAAAQGGPYANSYFNQLWNVTFADPTIQSGPPLTPVAHHSYQTSVHLPARDAWVRFGTQRTHPLDQGPGAPDNLRTLAVPWSEASKAVDSRAWSVDYTAQIPSIGSVPESPVALVHPWTDDVVYHCGGQVHLWKSATNTWVNRIEQYLFTDDRYAPRVIDPINNVVLCPGRPNLGEAPYLIDLNDFTTITPIAGSASSWQGPAATEFKSASHHLGYVWDDDNACVWCVKAGYGIDSTFDLFKLTLTSKAGCVWNVEKVSTTTGAAGDRPSFPSNTAEMGKTVQFSKELGGILVNTSFNAPIHFIRTAARA